MSQLPPVFLAAAVAIALTPGPGIFYVAARSLAGGRAEGLASGLGTGLGGLVHVVAGALGVAALVTASGTAFAALKFLGAGYLLWIGIKTIRGAGDMRVTNRLLRGCGPPFARVCWSSVQPQDGGVLPGAPAAVRRSRRWAVARQFVMLGLVSVALNTAVDVVVALLAARARHGLLRRPRLVCRLRTGSGLVICGLACRWRSAAARAEPHLAGRTTGTTAGPLAMIVAYDTERRPCTSRRTSARIALTSSTR